METITSVANAASKAIWGEPAPTAGSNEPVSGVMGDTAKGEPYDGGNSDEKAREVIEREERDPTSAAFQKLNIDDTDKDSAVDVGIPGTTTYETTAASTAASTNASTKAIADESALEPSRTAATTGVTAANSEPIPTTTTKTAEPAPSLPTERSRDEVGSEHARVDATAPDEQTDVPGTKHVKSTGLKADGGDFDAAQPGAGREADRILEEKGMHPNDATAADADADADSNSGNSQSSGSKMSHLKEKIKSKLHKN